MEVEATLGSTLDEPVPTGCVPVAVPELDNVPLGKGNGTDEREDALDNGLEIPELVTGVGDPLPVTEYDAVVFERGNGAEDERPPV